MAKGDTAQLGKWAFLIGLVLVIVAALIELPSDIVAWLFLILGAVVGILNITAKKTTEFLIAIIALMAVGSVGYGISALTGVQILGGFITSALSNLILFVAPAALIVSVLSIWLLASKK